MLSISVGKKSLDITDDISMTLKFQSPLFNDLGDYSFPFKLPLTARNKIILNWKHRIESSDNKYEFFASSVLWDGVELFSGSLRTQKAGQAFECVLYVDKGSFNWTIKNAMLHQVDLGSQIVPPNNLTYYNWTLDYYYPDTNLCFPPIHNEMYSGVQNTNEGEDGYNHVYTQMPIGIRILTPQGNISNIVPMLYLRYVLVRLAKIYGYELVDEFFNQSQDLQNLIIYNSKNIDYTSASQVMTNMLIYYQQHVPQISVKAFLQGLENYFNCRFFVNDLTKTITIKGGMDILSAPGTIPFSSGVTEMTILIADQLTGACLTIQSDDGDSVMSDIVEYANNAVSVIAGSVQTLSMLKVPPMSSIIMLGDIYYVIDVDAYYVAIWDYSLNKIQWQVTTNVVTSILESRYRYQSPNISKTESIFGFLDAEPVGEEVQCGNIKSEWKKITPRLMIAKIDPVMKALSTTNDLDLVLPNPGSIFYKFHQKWQDWIIDDRRNVEFKKQLDFLDIRNLDFSAKHEINGNKYLLNTVSVSLTRTEIKPAIINAYTCF